MARTKHRSGGLVTTGRTWPPWAASKPGRADPEFGRSGRQFPSGFSPRVSVRWRSVRFEYIRRQRAFYLKKKRNTTLFSCTSWKELYL